MNKSKEKLNLIYVPFLIIAVATIVGYTLINFFVFIRMHLFSIKEDIVNIWIPLVLPWIPVLIWLRPKIKLLNLKRKKGDLPFLYAMVAALAIAAPTVIAQLYIESASGQLSKLDNIGQITQQKDTKYYTLNHFYIDKQNIGVQTSFEVSGKNNEYFNMHLYVALPILSSEEDTSNFKCLAWYGVKYQKQISNRLGPTEKQSRFKEFADASQKDFDSKDVNQFVYLDRIGNTDDRKGYLAAIKNNQKYSRKSIAILIPINEPFEARNGNKLPWIFGAFAIGAFVWLLMVLAAKFDESALEKFQGGIKPEKKQSDSGEVLSLLLPRRGFYVTPLIIDINVLIFLIMVLSGLGFLSFSANDLLKWGGNFRPVTTNGQWWRLVTNTFLHGGLMHLLANMYGLLFVGIFLEPRIGRVRFAIIYLSTGILASLTSLWWHVATVSVGASGAIFGMYGLFLAFLLTKVFPRDFSKAFLASTLIFVGYNLLMGLSGGIDNAAHIGGLVSGFIVGLIISSQVKHGTSETSETLEPLMSVVADKD